MVLPCYNEEEGIRIVLSDMPTFVDEVVAVDNNSVDGTSAVAQDLGAIVVPEKRQGYGAAYKAGFRSATGDIIIAMDADGTYPRSFIPVILDVMFELDLDFITCDRTGHKLTRSSPLRVFGNWLLGMAMNVLFGMRVHDSQSGMWVFKRSILPSLRLTSDGMAFSEELKVEAFTKKHIHAAELPIYYRDRAGESKLNVWRDGFQNLAFLLKMRFGRRAPLPPTDPKTALTDATK